MIRNAEAKDLPVILEIYANARKFMVQTGNPTQWPEGYPSESLLRIDMENHNLYVVVEDGRICGVFALIIGPDETYSRIEQGRWLSESEYGTIHRVAETGRYTGFFPGSYPTAKRKYRIYGLIHTGTIRSCST